MSKQPPPVPTASAVGPCPTVSQIVGRPSTGSLPSTIAPPDHSHIYEGQPGIYKLPYVDNVVERVLFDRFPAILDPSTMTYVKTVEIKWSDALDPCEHIIGNKQSVSIYIMQEEAVCISIALYL